jgi:hypothetical protein
MRAKSITVVFVIALLALLMVGKVVNAASTECAMLPSNLAAQISVDEPWYCPINQQLYEQWAANLPMALAAILISISIAAIITMIGTALKSDKIRNFGMGEIYEAVASGIIVGLFLYVCAVLFGIIPALFVGDINPFPTALNLMTTTIYKIEQLYTIYYNQYMQYRFLTSIQTSIYITGVVELGSDLLAPAYVVPLELLYIAPLWTLTNILSDGMMVLWGEYYMLVFFASAAIPAFLIPGVILRAIFPTRALGGMLMALAIGFYLIMPTLFAVAYYFTAPGITQQLQVAADQATRFGAVTDVDSLTTPTSPMIMQVQGMQENVTSAISSFWLLILFYPLLIISMTYAFVTQIASFIGGVARSGAKLRGFI